MLISRFEGLLAYRTLPFGKALNKKAHMAFQSAGAFCACVGLIAVFLSHNDVAHGGVKPNLYTAHGWIGILVITLYFAQCVARRRSSSSSSLSSVVGGGVGGGACASAPFPRPPCPCPLPLPARSRPPFFQPQPEATPENDGRRSTGVSLAAPCHRRRRRPRSLSSPPGRGICSALREVRGRRGRVRAAARRPERARRAAAAARLPRPLPILLVWRLLCSG